MTRALMGGFGMCYLADYKAGVIASETERVAQNIVKLHSAQSQARCNATFRLLGPSQICGNKIVLHGKDADGSLYRT